MRSRPSLTIIDVARAFGCTVLLALAIGPAAQAATPPTQQLVARDRDTSLLARDDGDQICLRLQAGQSTSDTCSPAASGAVVVAPGPPPTGSPQYVGVAVPVTATRVELRRAGRLLVGAPTAAAGAYTGRHAAELRFALVALPTGTPTTGLRVRALDAAEGLVIALAPTDSALVTGRRTVLSGHARGATWRIASSRSAELTPSVLDAEREERSDCLKVTIRAGRSAGIDTACQGETPGVASLLLGDTFAAVVVSDRCAQRFRLVHGVVAGTLRSVRVVLGDGRTRRARTAAYPGGRTAYALVVPAAAAVRRVLLRDASGGASAREVAAPPLAVRCAGGDDDVDVSAGDFAAFTRASPLANLPPVAPTGPVATLPGTPAARIADGPGQTLCVAVGGQPFTVLGCAAIAPIPGELTGTVDSYTRPRAFVLAVPAAVVTVRIAGVNGVGTRDIPTVPGDGYTGVYAGRVRFAAAEIASVRELSRTELVDATGRVLQREVDDSEETDLQPPRFLATRRRAGRPGRPSLWQTPVVTQGRTALCLALTPGPPPAADADCPTVAPSRETPVVLLRASCAPRGLSVAVKARPGTRVTLRLGAGRTRALPLASGAGVLTLAPGEALRSVRLSRGRRTTIVPIHAPPARTQCGWSADPPVGSR